MARRTTEIEEITAAQYRYHPSGRWPMLHVEFDGREADIGYEQKLLRYGFVFLGSAFSDFEVIVPADPGNGRPRPQQFAGFTNDVRLVHLTQEYLQKLEDNSWMPGPVKVG